MTTTASELTVAEGEREFGSRLPRSLWSDARRRLLRNKASVAGMVYIAILILVALFSGVQPPHLLVCDTLGLDSSWYTVPSVQKKLG